VHKATDKALNRQFTAMGVSPDQLEPSNCCATRSRHKFLKLA